MVICVVIVCSKLYNRPHLPKGPGYLELINTFIALGKGTHMHEVVRGFNKVYGDVFTLAMGQTSIVMVSSKDGLKEGMLTKGLDFADRPNLYAANLNYGGDRNNGIFISDYNTKCKLKRKLFLSALRLRGEMQVVLEQKILQETLNVLQSFKQQPKVGFDPKEIVMCSVMNITFHILFNKHYTPDDKEFLTIMHNVDTRFRAYVTLLYLDLFPVLRLLPHKNRKTIEDCNNWLLELVQRFIDEHRSTLEDVTKPRDVIDKVLIEQEEDNDGQLLSDKDLQWSFVNVITAGFDTTGLTTLWGLALLAKNPNIQTCSPSVRPRINVYQINLSHHSPEQAPK
ncbi:unnamed protein product [Owenia fusiformis]|uniref:Cytochrome P450 n=1 Tax=Owenia fusiformis TaxID=6347 RepID=A0A8S4N1N8_OWEFU|nr:unnamed protein product [Owenia fusiformis]